MKNELGKCSVCGEDLTKFGNKELKDGILCRNCVKLASPWLTDEEYREMSVEQMKKHLEYREKNLAKLESFVKSRKVEGKYSLYIDDENGNFLISKKKDLKKDNPDVMPLEGIQEITVSEEKYPDGEGTDVYFETKLEGGEFSTVRLRVNEFPGALRDSDEFREAEKLALDYLDALASDDFEEVKEG